MANETKFVYGTLKEITSSANGPAVTTMQLSSALTNLYSQTDTLDYPDAVFTLTLASSSAFSATYTAGSTLDLYVVPQDVDGSTGDQVDPLTGASTNAYRGRYLCSFVCDGTTTASLKYTADAFGIPRAGKLFLFNGTSANLGANWKLQMTPRTLGPV